MSFSKDCKAQRPSRCTSLMPAERHKVAPGSAIVQNTVQRRPACLLIVHYFSNTLLIVQNHDTRLSRAIDLAWCMALGASIKGRAIEHARSSYALIWLRLLSCGKGSTLDKSDSHAEAHQQQQQRLLDSLVDSLLLRTLSKAFVDGLGRIERCSTAARACSMEPRQRRKATVAAIAAKASAAAVAQQQQCAVGGATGQRGLSHRSVQQGSLAMPRSQTFTAKFISMMFVVLPPQLMLESKTRHLQRTIKICAHTHAAHAVGKNQQGASHIT
eukprot:3312-Heterococcus_DN1.PRE.6